MENLDWKIPLWKMRITNQQYSELKSELHAAFNSPYHYRIQAYAKEAALYYSEWWRREYNGGAPSKEAIAKSIDPISCYSKDLFELAKIGGERLKIPVVLKPKRYWFRSLLIQGGLPINHIKSNPDNIISYRNFLIGLVRYTSDIRVSYDDISFIDKLDCTHYLPETFKNEGIYELSLLIARAINENNDDLLPYDLEEGGWNELTNDLKKIARSDYVRSVPFIVCWRLHKANSTIVLSYGVELAKKISNSYLENKLNGTYSFSLFVQGRYIASYSRTSNNDFICRDKKISDFKWNEEPVISLHIKTDLNQIIDLTVPNSFAPDLEIPQLLVEFNGFWHFKSGTSNSNNNAITLPDGWEVPGDVEEVFLVGQRLNWHEFPDCITAINKITGEEIIFDNSITQYWCEFAGWSIDWIQSANYKILTIEPDIRLYDESFHKIKTGDVFYREYLGRVWEKYERYKLPVGLLEFKIILPDGKSIREKFYYVGAITCAFDNLASSSGNVLWGWKHGLIYPFTDQLGIEIIEVGHNNWRVDRLTNQVDYPDLTKFKLIPCPNPTKSPALEISVASPFQGVVLLDSNRKEVPNGKVLCSTSLYGFRYIVMGKTVPSKIFHIQNPNIVISSQLNQGIHALSRFEDDIREMFILNGSDPFDVDSKVRVVIGQGGTNKMVDVKEYNVFSRSIGKCGPIVIIDNPTDLNIIDYHGQLMGVSVDCNSEEIRVEELTKSDGGFYFAVGHELERFILFSGDSSNQFSDLQRIVPRFFNWSDHDIQSDQKQDSGLNPQQANIKNIRELLDEAQAFSEEWRKVIEYFNIVIKYSLPFRTMNCFRAIAQSPILLAKMVCILSQSTTTTKDDLLSGLSCFEGEFAVAFHWINDKHWSDSIDWLLMAIPEIALTQTLLGVFEMRRALLDFTLHSKTEESLNCLLNFQKCIGFEQPPTIGRINEIRAKIGSNTNLPKKIIFIPNSWTGLFPYAIDPVLPIFVRALLNSPVISALAVTGNYESIWDESNSELRRTINFHRQFLPSEYFEILICMIKRIYSNN